MLPITSQKALAYKVAQAILRQLWGGADDEGRARLQARCAPGAAAWLQVPPTLDLALTNGQFATALAYQAHAPLEEGALAPCRLCGRPHNVFGWQDQSCGGAGGQIHRRTEIRGMFYELARRAGVRPVSYTHLTLPTILRV